MRLEIKNLEFTRLLQIEDDNTIYIVMSDGKPLLEIAEENNQLGEKEYVIGFCDDIARKQITSTTFSQILEFITQHFS